MPIFRRFHVIQPKFASRLAALVLLLAALLVIPGCGGGGGGGGSAPPASSSSGSAGGGGGTVQDPLSPAAAPQAPSSAPPRVGPANRATEDISAAGPTTTVSYNFPAGWSLVSFPLASVSSTSGFTHQMYAYQGTTYVTVDPVANPTGIDTRKGFWVYFESATSATVTGPSNSDGTLTTLPLQAGWNLVGCPSGSALPTAKMTLTRQGGATQVLEEVSSPSYNAGSQWLYSYLFALQPGGQYVTSELTGSNVSLTPKAGHWIFSWTAADLNLNVIPPSPVPNVTSVSPSSVAVGGTLTLNGSGFGAAGTGVVSVRGVAVPAANITSWTATSIQLTVPAGLPSGNVVVLVNRYPSNRVALTVTGGGGGGTTGTLSGKVQSSGGSALQGAQVMVDTGQSAVSDSNGNFTIEGIPAGTHLVYVTRIGYRTAAGEVTVDAGATRTVLVTLSPTSGGGGDPGEETGNLYVRGHAWDYGGTRYWAYRIEVQEYGNYSERWSDTFYNDNGDTYKQVVADGAIVGRTYVIKVTWRNANGQEYSNTWWRRLDSTSQTENFYNP